MVVGLLVEQSRQWQRQWIAAFNVQFLRECRRPNGFRKRQAVDLLVVVVVLVRLPVFVEVKSVDSSVCGTRWDAGRTRGGARGRAGGMV